MESKEERAFPLLPTAAVPGPGAYRLDNPTGNLLIPVTNHTQPAWTTPIGNFLIPVTNPTLPAWTTLDPATATTTITTATTSRTVALSVAGSRVPRCSPPSPT